MLTNPDIVWQSKIAAKLYEFKQGLVEDEYVKIFVEKWDPSFIKDAKEAIEWIESAVEERRIWEVSNSDRLLALKLNVAGTQKSLQERISTLDKHKTDPCFLQQGVSMELDSMLVKDTQLVGQALGIIQTLARLKDDIQTNGTDFYQRFFNISQEAESHFDARLEAKLAEASLMQAIRDLEPDKMSDSINSILTSLDMKIQDLSAKGQQNAVGLLLPIRQAVIDCVELIKKELNISKTMPTLTPNQSPSETPPGLYFSQGIQPASEPVNLDNNNDEQHINRNGLI